MLFRSGLVLPADVDPELALPARIAVCFFDSTSDEYVVREEVANARELNGRAFIEFQAPDNILENRCTADPVTGQGGGIKVADVIDDITQACEDLNL